MGETCNQSRQLFRTDLPEKCNSTHGGRWRRCLQRVHDVRVEKPHHKLIKQRSVVLLKFGGSNRVAQEVGEVKETPA